MLCFQHMMPTNVNIEFVGYMQNIVTKDSIL